MAAANVFGAGVATLGAVPLVRGLARPSVRGKPMFFAMKSCHRWRAADSAFAFAHHFYLPLALPRHPRSAFPVLPSAFFLLSGPAAKETRAVPRAIHPFDFKRLNINAHLSRPSTHEGYGSVNCQVSRPCVAAYSFRALGTIVRPATSTLGQTCASHHPCAQAIWQSQNTPVARHIQVAIGIARDSSCRWLGSWR
jgi:hypothetical protein